MLYFVLRSRDDEVKDSAPGIPVQEKTKTEYIQRKKKKKRLFYFHFEKV